MKFNDVSLRPWLNTWMKQNQKSTPWLAEAMGLSERQTQKYLHDKGPISVEYIKIISQAIGVDMFVMLLSEESKALYDRGWALAEEERKAMLAKEEETKLEMAERRIEEMEKKMREMMEKMEGK